MDPCVHYFSGNSMHSVDMKMEHIITKLEKAKRHCGTAPVAAQALIDEAIVAIRQSDPISLERAYEAIQEHEEVRHNEHQRKKALPCPCCKGETDDYGDCYRCDVMLLDGCHRAQDCDQFHTHSNRCMVPYEDFAAKHPGVTPKERALKLLREHHTRILDKNKEA